MDIKKCKLTPEEILEDYLKRGSMSNNVRAEIEKQSQNISPSNFICSGCKSYKGSCACEMNVFIAFEGANLSTCYFYQRGRKCPHCGRII